MVIVLLSVCPLGGAMHAMYCYSPLSDSWSLITRLGERASCAIAACNNKLFITGGRDNKNQIISTVMCWDVGRGVLTEECVLPMGVSHHGSVTLMKSYTHIHRITPVSESQWHSFGEQDIIGTKWKWRTFLHFYHVHFTLSNIRSQSPCITLSRKMYVTTETGETWFDADKKQLKSRVYCKYKSITDEHRICISNVIPISTPFYSYMINK